MWSSHGMLSPLVQTQSSTSQSSVPVAGGSSGVAVKVRVVVVFGRVFPVEEFSGVAVKVRAVVVLGRVSPWEDEVGERRNELGDGEGSCVSKGVSRRGLDQCTGPGGLIRGGGIRLEKGFGSG